MIGRSFGRYRVVSKLGQGGLATVWRAQDELLGRPVALKLLHENYAESEIARQRFLREARTAAALDHPGIITIHDQGEADGQVYIAFALIEGETVSARAAHRLMPFREALRVASAAATALQYAHEHHVIHRDVTGRNIMIAKDGRVVLLDFGLALADWEARLTTTDTRMGTAYYMPSEVILGRPATARSDVYGLGVVLYEMLTGGFPFTSERPEGVLNAALNEPPVAPRARRPDIPEELEAVVLRAIAREPAERHASATAFEVALNEIASTSSAGPAAGPAPGPRHRDGTRSGIEAVTPDAATAPIVPSPLTGGPHYLAVLPFEVAGANADPEDATTPLAGRLGETLGCALARAPGLRVVPVPPSSLPADPRAAARELGANLLLRGSVRREGMRLRVSYSVLDSRSGLTVAGDVVDGSALRAFDVEDRVVASVQRALGLEWLASDRLPSSRPDPAAADHYRQALGNLRRYDHEASVDGAVRLLEGLVASDGNVAAHHAMLARAYLYKHGLTREPLWESRAAAECELAKDLDPNAPEVLTALGYLRLNAGQHEAAIEEFARALAREGATIDARLGLAHALALAGRHEEAERVCDVAVSEHPDDWRGHSLLGWIRLREHRFEEALFPWRRVVELTPDNARGRRNLGTAYYRLDRYDDAVEAYRGSLAIQPNDEAYSNLGAALYAMGRYEEAIEAFRSAVALTAGDPLRWGNLGVACRWVPGHEAEATVPLERAIGLMRERLDRNPARADWWALMAGWLATSGRLDQARTAIERAIELDPEDVEVMLHAGDVHFQLGERTECLDWFRRARAAGCGLAHLLNSPSLAPLRADPEFVAILDQKVDAAHPSPGRQ